MTSPVFFCSICRIYVKVDINDIFMRLSKTSSINPPEMKAKNNIVFETYGVYVERYNVIKGIRCSIREEIQVTFVCLLYN